MSENKEVRYITGAELANRWRISYGTVCNWRAQGKGPPFIKLGLKVLYSIAVVEEWEKRAEEFFTNGRPTGELRQ